MVPAISAATVAAPAAAPEVSGNEGGPSSPPRSVFVDGLPSCLQNWCIGRRHPAQPSGVTAMQPSPLIQNTHGILPEGETVRRAIRWIADRRHEVSQDSLSGLVGRAARQYDLSPKEEEALLHLLEAGA